MYISGAKFEDNCFNISGDILDSVFYPFCGTIYDVITSLICIIQKRKYLSRVETVRPLTRRINKERLFVVLKCHL